MPPDGLAGTYLSGTHGDADLEPWNPVPAGRAHTMSPELWLWASAVQDAIQCAQRFGRGLKNPGESVATLTEWATEDYHGSLSWICRHISAAIGEAVAPDGIRKTVLEAIAGAPQRKVRRGVADILKRRARIVPADREARAA